MRLTLERQLISRFRKIEKFVGEFQPRRKNEGPAADDDAKNEDVENARDGPSRELQEHGLCLIQMLHVKDVSS